MRRFAYLTRHAFDTPAGS